MARMIPSDETREDFNHSVGEERVYNALKALPDEYVVFHSVHWQSKGNRGQSVWGESDFTVLHPKRGVLVIEVKSGGIDCRDGTWYQTNTITQVTKPMKDPLVQAERSKYTFIDLFESAPASVHKYWVEAAVWFPSLKDNSEISFYPPAYTPSIVLTAKNLDNAKKSIDAVFDSYGMSEKPYYSEEDAAFAIQKLSPSFNAIPSMSVRVAEQDYLFHRMTTEQSYLLDYLEEQQIAAIQGGAGTGKTMLALEKAKRLSINSRVLFLCFNKFLLDKLIKDHAQEYPNIDFFNLQALTCKFTGNSDAGGNDGISEFLLFADEHDSWVYDNIIIDEGQDFLEDHLSLLYSIAERRGGAFYVFYDKNQLVQQRQSLDWVKSIECRLVLTANCRNTRNIAVTSNKPIGIEKIKMRQEIPGEKPNLYISSTSDNAIDRIASIIRMYTDAGLKKSDIVILTVKTLENSLLTGITRVGSYKLVREINEQGVLFTTCRKFKGLEAKVIIVVDMDDTTFANEEARRVLYVGTSRAQHYLDFVSVMHSDQIERLAAYIQGKAVKNAKLILSSQLKVKVISE